MYPLTHDDVSNSDYEKRRTEHEPIEALTAGPCGDHERGATPAGGLARPKVRGDEPIPRYHGQWLWRHRRRWRLLRTLAHTVGTNAAFAGFAVAAEALTRAGGADRLTDWRLAAICERRNCKPDGYACYVREGDMGSCPSTTATPSQFGSTAQSCGRTRSTATAGRPGVTTMASLRCSS
jgi:hypothetical protein